MSGERVYIASNDMLTSYGQGVEVCWDGLMAGRSALSRVVRFDTGAFHSDIAGTVTGIEYKETESLVLQMLKKIFEDSQGVIPEDARLILATTKGEVDLLERSLLQGNDPAHESEPKYLLEKVRRLAGVNDPGIVISAACASSTAALARAASMIRSGDSESVLVVACDSVTEFIFSGFSTLMALDKRSARPFDRDRSGLNIGEGAAFALVMSGSRVKRDRREIFGEISGWGLSADANHMTGPARDGSGQAAAIRKALKSAGCDSSQVGSISAHGTGTVYNDAMEMKAIHAVFYDDKRPVYSVKGGLGHTMGAAGLIEALLALRSLREKTAPPTVNLTCADQEAEGWVFAEPCSLDPEKGVLSTNSGFGGVNAALVLSLPEVP